MHISDIHLGYQQYNSKERFNDSSLVFLFLFRIRSSHTADGASARPEETHS
jgi:DNA repair exonuclease SbcCD nuclease subunit